MYGAPFTSLDFLNAKQIQPVTDEVTRAAVRAGIMSEAFHIGQYCATISAATRASVTAGIMSEAFHIGQYLKLSLLATRTSVRV